MKLLVRLLAGRWARLVLVGLLAAALQSTVATDLRPFGVAAQPALLVAVAIGVARGPADGLLGGLVVGLVADLAFGDVVGLGAVGLGIAGAIAGMLLLPLRDPPWWTRIVAMAAASAAGEAIHPVLKTLVGLDGWVHPRVATVAVIVAGLHLAVAPMALVVGRWASSTAAEGSE
jgi:rod shape-determining protein MreD